MSDSDSAVSPIVKPKRSYWKSLVLGVVIFVSGMVVGSGLTVRFLWVRIMHSIHNADYLHERLLHRVERRLDLTEEQTERVREILQKHQKRFLKIREETGPKIVAEIQQLRDEIDTVLTPSQSEEWRHWLENMHKTWLKPFADLHTSHDALLNGEGGDEDR